MAYWLHCQFCGEWSKSLAPLSDDKSCSFCSRSFKAIKPYQNIPVKSLASKPEDGRKNDQRDAIEVEETSRLPEIEVPEPEKQRTVLSEKKAESSNIVRAEETHAIEIPVNYNPEDTFQELEEIESSGECDIAESLGSDDEVDVNASYEEEVASQAVESNQDANINNRAETTDTSQVEEASKAEDEEELVETEETERLGSGETSAEPALEMSWTMAIPELLEVVDNLEEGDAAKVSETGEGRDYKDISELTSFKEESDLVIDAEVENKSSCGTYIAPEPSPDDDAVRLDISDSPKTDKIRITFTYGEPKSPGTSEEPVLLEPESGAALETIEEKVAAEALDTLQADSESGVETTGIEASNKKPYTIDFSQPTEKEVISEMEEFEGKQEVPEDQEYQSFQSDQVEDDESGLSDDVAPGNQIESSKMPADIVETIRTIDIETEPELAEAEPEMERKDGIHSESSPTDQEEDMPMTRSMPRMTRTYESYIEMRRRTRNIGNNL